MTASWPFAGLKRGHYRCISADPPWTFKNYTDDIGDRDVRRHYDTLSLPQIKALPVGDLAPCDAHLFLWATGPHLPLALEVMTAWGFRYSSIAFTWVKLKRSLGRAGVWVGGFRETDLHVGLGHTTRKNAEFVLLGRRGNCRRNAKDIREIILSPVREHSRKPDEAYRRMARYCDGPRVELFARERRPGWRAWGDQAGKFDEQKEPEAAA